MARINEQLNEHPVETAVVLAVFGFLFAILWQIIEMRREITETRLEITETRLEISRVEVKLSADIHKMRVETNTEISGLRERMGVLEVLVRAPEPQASAHADASAEPSAAHEPSPETSGQSRTSARP